MAKTSDRVKTLLLQPLITICAHSQHGSRCLRASGGHEISMIALQTNLSVKRYVWWLNHSRHVGGARMFPRFATMDPNLLSILKEWFEMILIRYACRLGEFTRYLSRNEHLCRETTHIARLRWSCCIRLLCFRFTSPTPGLTPCDCR